jgi:phospho-N-acetylmuramoyl-pentapeptide-transferase
MDILLNLPLQVKTFLSVFVLALITGPILIPVLIRLKFGQTERELGPASHKKKTGTPLFGGLIFIIPIIIAAIFIHPIYPEILPMVLTTIGFGAVGFIDDYIKVFRKNNKGLDEKQKTIGLFIVAILYTVYLVLYTGLGTGTLIPFFGKEIILPVWLYTIFIVITMYLTTNAVNLTDGVDGLCGGVTLIVSVFFAVAAAGIYEWEYIQVFSAMIAAGCLGFLVFNIHPAKVFMGDTGSLALGGAVSVMAIMMRMPLIILIVGGIYVIEALSVVIQVYSFKRTGKRVFRMAPIHHHFELSGWKETKVVNVFWGVTMVLCLIGLSAV